jgi:transcriptional regulator with XRE-family HTH domain
VSTHENEKGKKMLTLDEIIKKLGDRNLTKVSAECGLTRPFLSAIRSGKIKNPSYDTIVKLSNYLES